MYFAKGTEPTEYCMDHVDDKEEFEKTSEEKKKQVGGKNIFLGDTRGYSNKMWNSLYCHSLSVNRYSLSNRRYIKKSLIYFKL